MKQLFSLQSIPGGTYFKLMLLTILAPVIYAVVYVFILAIFDQTPQSNTFYGIFVGVLTLLLIGFAIASIVMSLVLIMRRAQDTSSFIVWLIIGLLIPFGWIVLGFIPSKK